MLILIILIALICTGFGCYFYNKSFKIQRDISPIYETFFIIALIIGIVAIPASAKLTNYIVEGTLHNDMIEMYQEENEVIEKEVSIIVNNYQNHEKEVFTNVKTNSPITLATLFPELKSNELVSKQINLYMTNNEKIKELKTKKLNIKVYAWWLYFGK